jgi:membrane protease YdiL (CAAX protease family)
MTAVGLYVFHLWRHDYLADRSGRPNPRALPGATPASVKACAIASGGAIMILVAETLGEMRLGLSDEQSTMTVLFGLYTLIAAFIEELIFRGFIVIDGKGKTLRWMGIVGASVLFAALHPFLWKWEVGEADGLNALMVWRWDEWFSWQWSAKGWFSTAAVFVSSLWFYIVRFAAFNGRQSLIPCIVAHVTKNSGVFVIKGIQGFIVGWW